MTAELKVVVWDWFGALLAGLIPLLIFLLVSVTAISTPNEDPAVWWVHFYGELVDQLLVLAIVTSTVSTFTAVPRLVKGRGSPDGAITLIMIVTVVLIASVVLYVLQQTHVAPVVSLFGISFLLAVGLVLAASVSSYYLAVTVTNLGLRKTRKAT